MKRLIYISRMTESVSSTDLHKIGETSQRNNRELEITGVLLYLNGLFFQILEGNEERIDNLYTKILIDNRHKDIMCLQSEENISARLFPDWDMQVINLEENEDIFIRPLKSLLQALSSSHHILEKYTQHVVVRALNQGQNPLLLKPRNQHKFVLFADIFGFSTFTEKLPPQELVDLVNEYFNLTSRAIAERGGSILKYMGDCVMASFEQDQADEVMQATLDILKILRMTRRESTPTHPGKLLYTGIGLAYGEVVEGNMGSQIKMDYTLVGDTVNVASRMETLTRKVPYTVVLTEAVKQQCSEQWAFIELGEKQVKGKQEKIKTYSIDHPLCHKTPEMQRQIDNLGLLLEAFNKTGIIT
ncbi:BLUF domain-containing protein [Candidatus Albibeggiatoa sp. nov. NOAA]|uniref:BLUF domain-containing protein n=1 Tax=Candidatus Albibeggiatoa sp. nov. NOAA TaxID=3162724 RepID=UPI0033036D67|nr:BLUF domain-containing protein [Thiotrichaceae bacterium]